MKKFIPILAAALFFLACDYKKKSSKESQPGSDITTKVANDSSEIRNVIIDFYTWYAGNYSRMTGYQLYSGIKKQDQPPYKINWPEVERYQAFIRDSIPQLGEDFLVNQKNMFRKCDSAFKVDLQDEIPYGFDYDWFTNNQESASYLLDGIKASGKWIISVKDNTAAVEIGAPDDKNYLAGSLLLFVGLKKENGQWKIAQIGND